MAFYLTPPTGTISLQRLTQFAYTRFTFLCKILETQGNRVELFDVVKEIETVEDSECLIEGTSKDKISHAILRLACCEDKDMSEFLLTAETLLFDFRFSCMTKEELCKVLRSVDRYRKGGQLSRIESVSSILATLFNIRKHHCSWRAVVERYLTGEGYFSVQFQTVLHLVARRKVSLDQGMAHVPFYRLREMITGIFRKLLLHGLQFARPKTIDDDARIIEVVKVLKVLFRHKYRGVLHRSVPCELLHTQIDELVSQFPPCMAHLHRVLRRKHRLNHHARIQYTLFLKEIGLPVHEAVIFWRTEYSKSPHETTGCGHDWSTNERRYTYSIRHLYGLEGSRINYRGHSCQALQENYHGMLDEGGCPFSHFDKQHLVQLLCEEDVQEGMSEILSLQELGRFSEACNTLHHVKLKTLLKEHGSSTKADQVKCGGDIKSVNTSRNPCIKLGHEGRCCIQPSSKRQRLSVDVEDIVHKKANNVLELLDKSDTCICECNSSHIGGTELLKGFPENKNNVCYISKQIDMTKTDLKGAITGDDTYCCDCLSSKLINSRSKKYDRHIHENCSRINHRDEHYVSNSDMIMNKASECLNNSERNNATYSLLSSDVISKPVDFYLSYAKLLKNLQENHVCVK